MARCPECRKSFRCMEDEPADECPYCGYTGRCPYCESSKCVEAECLDVVETTDETEQVV